MSEEPNVPDISHLDLTGKIEITKQTDWGAYSDVSRGTLRTGAGNVEVAVKALRLCTNNADSSNPTSSEDRLLKRFYREILVWERLRHENVVPLIGFTMQPGDLPTLISPWYINSNIVQYLKSNPEVDRLHLICDVARGLQYLHSFPIAHGDIKGENVLVNANGSASLCDFGMSQFLGDVGQISGLSSSGSLTLGTLRFVSPELLDGQPRTSMSDIWAFGCLVMQISTNQVPYSHISSSCALPLAITRGDTPMNIEQQRSDTPEEQRLWDYVGRCWNKNPQNRPTAQQFLDNAHVPVPDNTQERGNCLTRDVMGPPDVDMPLYSEATNAANQNWGLTLPALPHRLYKMLQDPEASRHMYWTPGGRSFIIVFTPEFVQEILLRYFKHTNVKRFLSKLEKYDFRRTENHASSMENHVEFSHPQFLRDNSDLLSNVQENADKLGIMSSHQIHRSPALMVGGPAIGLRRRPSKLSRVSLEHVSPRSPQPLMSSSTETGLNAVVSEQLSLSSLRSGGKSQKTDPAEFVKKLYAVLGDSSISDCISWTSKGRSFIIRDTPELSKEILPKCFDYSKCSSLFRQLKIYDFQVLKANRPTKQGGVLTVEYSHPKFRRDHPELLGEVCMLLTSTTSDESDQSDIVLFEGLFDSKSTGRGSTSSFPQLALPRPFNHPIGPAASNSWPFLGSRRSSVASTSAVPRDFAHRAQILEQFIPLPPPLSASLLAPGAVTWPAGFADSLNFDTSEETNRTVQQESSGQSTVSNEYTAPTSPQSEFILALHQQLENQEPPNHLSWEPDGKSFVVHFSNSFELDVLATHFQDCSVFFFQEQLRAQGFREIGRVSRPDASDDVRSVRYKHPKFRRGRQDLLPQVREGAAITLRTRQLNPSRTGDTRSTVSATAIGTNVSLSSTAVASSTSTSTRSSGKRKRYSRTPDSE